MRLSKAEGAKFFVEFGKMLRQVNGQIVEDKANKVIARGDVLPVETAGLVDEDADFLCLFHSCAKGKMKAGISPRQQRRLLRLPVTPVLPFVGRYYGINSDLVQGGLYSGGQDRASGVDRVQSI